MTIDIQHCHEVLRGALVALLPAPAGGLHWLRAPLRPKGEEYTYPFAVLTVPGAGTLRKWIGMPPMWEGDVIVRVHAATLDAAETAARALTATVPDASVAADPVGGLGWDLTLRAGVAAPVPPSQTSAQAVIAYRVQLQRRTA